MEVTQTKRTSIRRHKDRASYDLTLIQSIIEDCVIGHIAFDHEGSKHSIPMPLWCVGDYMYCHSAINGRLANLAGEQTVCVSFAIVDAVVMAKAALRHSLNYRSVVVYGQFEPVEANTEKLIALEQFMTLFDIDEYRWAKVRQPSRKELNATAMMKLSLSESVAKVRTGPAHDVGADLAIDVWAGIVPKLHTYGEPIAVE